MKFNNWNSSSSLVINMIFETADLGLRVKAWTSLNSKLNAPDFFYIWQSEQIEHGNYEYINCNWLPWPKTEMWSNFYEISHLEQIKHANYIYIEYTWNWFSWPKIMNSGKFSPKIKICAMFTNFDTQNLLNILIFISNFEFKTWPKILDLGRFGPTFQI